MSKRAPESQGNVVQQPNFEQSLFHRTKADMVIIGGGPAGVYLADVVHQRQGDKFKVIVLEQGDNLQGSARAGLKQFRTLQGEPAIADLVAPTERWYQQLGQEVDGNSESFIKRFPYLFTAQTPKELATIAVDLGKAQHAGYGADAKILDADEVKERYPFVDGEIAGAVYYPDAGKFDFPRAIGHITERAKNTTFALNTTAGEVVIKRGKVVGVHTDRGYIKTSRVVLAPGAFALGAEDRYVGGRDVLKGGNRTTDTVTLTNENGSTETVPLISVIKRQSFVAPIEGLNIRQAGTEPGKETAVYPIHPDGSYVRIEVDENGKGIGTYGWAHPDDLQVIGTPEVLPRATEQNFPGNVYASLGEIISGYGTTDNPGPLATTPEVRNAGYYTQTPDDIPIADSTPIPGLYIMFALSHAGIMTGEGTAEVLVNKIWDLNKPKRLARFRRKAPEAPVDDPYASDRDFTKRRGRPL